MKLIIIWLISFHCISFSSKGQAVQKSITHNTQSWVGFISNIFIDQHWFITADLHLRENDFFRSNSFFLGRVGVGYQLNEKLSVVGGYANLLSAPAMSGGKTSSDENRIFQQVQFTSSAKKISIVQRIRNEQRWQAIIVNDQNTGKSKFSNRVRYLLSITIPIFKNKKLPQLVLADEVMLQFGRNIVNNTFDQNRIFTGIRQKITKTLSFDAGYMNVFQQKSNGSSYNRNDTYRLFLYYNLHAKRTTK